MFSLNKEASFVAASSSGIARGLRVKLDENGKLVPAGLADIEIGITNTMSSNGTDPVSVILRGTPGSVEVAAAAAIAQYAPVRRAASGKVASDGAGDVIGIALEAATAADDWIEVLKNEVYLPAAPAVVVDADGRTLLAADSGKVFSNSGAVGAATFALPPATVGLGFTFLLLAAQELRLDPDGTETIAGTNNVQGAAGKYLVADAVGESLEIACIVAGTWNVLRSSGTWTHEA